jgi:hypothetical protein
MKVQTLAVAHGLSDRNRALLALIAERNQTLWPSWRNSPAAPNPTCQNTLNYREVWLGPA